MGEKNKMATKEQYELGARILIKRIRDTPYQVEKMRLMSYLKNLRTSQYKTTGEERAKILAKNCLRAEEKLLIKGIRLYGLDKTLIEQYEWYSYRFKMEELNKRVANGEKIPSYQALKLEKYNQEVEESRFDRSCDI